ncbi:MAG: thioredoxin [Candidatus Jacksonbacteria bacterium]|nr:thioredoxin [Candidatus Jacksonbacteria bacterium]
MLELNEDTFDGEALAGETLALVDFWAPWCGPCKMQGPIVEELAKECEGKPVKIAKVNIDENQNLALRYKIVSIPTIGIFSGGVLKEQMIGVHDKDALKEKLEKYLRI